ncbi:MAG: phosphoserine phosphatase SerB [Alphaproteobacteria bacterium]|nr:phosphoserine phosphatase SerB [Alphaproteobacteria bacterium]MBU0858961.1 phosphoserine phosphatase SerB [Alphaproteobacteria bacterium]
MSFLVTLVASTTPLTAAHVAALDLRAVPHWMAVGKAVDIPVHEKPTHAQIAAWRVLLGPDKIDVFVTSSENRVKKLMLSDMDSTIVAEETLDEVAAAVGLGEVISALTARSMRGELEFEDTLRARVEMLKDTPAAVLTKIRDNVTYNPGAHELVAGMRAQGAPAVLVSGGFTYFSGHIAEATGFDFHHANVLEILNGLLTGQVIPPILGKNTKREILEEYCERLSLTPADVFAIGDGANDLPMLQTAGLGIGYRPKPLLLEALDNCIIHGDLTAALYAQGLTPTTM